MALNQRQQRAIGALLTNQTRRGAADAAGISERTLRGYLSDDEFVSEYRKAAQQAVDDATRQARQALAPAIATLQEIAENSDEPSTARVSAARALLDYGLRLVELNDVIYILREAEGE